MNGFEIKMSEKERADISSLIETNFGIKMPPVKKVLLTSRLSKRLDALGLKSYSDYYKYITTEKGSHDELHIFTDLVSTHETSFFREPQHFEYLFKTALPQLLDDRGAGVKKQLRVLSSACSTGEEAYTISMTMEEFIRNNGLNSYSYKITGTDISKKVVSSAARGVYHESRIGNLPNEYKRKYFMRGKGVKSELVRVIPELRASAEFFCMNLMDESYPFADKFDIILFRNAMIYFDRENQEKILGRLAGHLDKGGYLMIGHSETMSGYNLPLRCVATAIYRRV
ncbi:MAG TPA: CheR family methyltransferase [Spirochaetota bacterium]|nr:CheR family methyltransferase [Spirochaetota bacterium]HPS87926.1 CheR family methyltransferase [Spirochaetota bacterium]